MKKKQSYLVGASSLALATFFAKFVGAFYRIPLTNILGAEGIGVYQLIFPVYSLLLTSSSGALPIAISMLVSQSLIREDINETRKRFTAIMSIMLLFSLLSTLALVLLSRPLSLLQRNEMAVIGYVAVAPSIFFVAGIAGFRGFFQGMSNMKPTSLSHATEAIVKLIFGLGLALILLPYGLQFAVFGAFIGITLSEFISFIMMYSIYRKYNGKLNLNLNVKENRRVYKDILKISIPITIGGIIIPIVQFIDSILVVNILIRIGQSVSQATSSYGMFTGPVSSLINLPVVLSLSLGIAVIPMLARVKEKRNITEIKEKSDTALKLALVIGVPFAVLYFTMAENILNILYPRLTGAEISLGIILMKIGAVTIIILSMMQIFTSLLQGLGKTLTPVKNLAIAAIFKIVLDIILLYAMGIIGVAIASLVCYTIAMILNMISYVRLTGKSQRFAKNSCIITVSGATMAIVIYLGSLFFASAGTLIIMIFGGLIYLIVLLALGVFSNAQLESMPLGKFWIRLSKGLRIWER